MIHLYVLFLYGTCKLHSSGQWACLANVIYTRQEISVLYCFSMHILSSTSVPLHTSIQLVNVLSLNTSAIMNFRDTIYEHWTIDVTHMFSWYAWQAATNQRTSVCYPHTFSFRTVWNGRAGVKPETVHLVLRRVGYLYFLFSFPFSSTTTT